MLLAANNAEAAEKQYPVVLELFTSQSCSSCPPADAVLKQTSESNQSVLALSFHVDYWNHLSWKDTYSKPEYTQRQRDYNDVLGAGVFTPQLVANGAISANGANEDQVDGAIANAKQTPPQFNISIAPKNNQLAVTIKALPNAPSSVDIWEVTFDRMAKIKIPSGENGGRELTSINNVTSLKKLANWTPGATSIIIDAPKSDSIAILVQTPNFGRILAAAAYK